MGATTHRYDIAISYSKENRNFAKKIVGALKSDFKVFFDIDSEHMLSCRQLHEVLYTVYYRESDYSIMIISNEYLKRPHPMWEAYTILSKNLFGRNRYFIILDTDVDPQIVCEKLFINYRDFRFYTRQTLDGSEQEFDKFISEVKKRLVDATPNI